MSLGVRIDINGRLIASMEIQRVVSSERGTHSYTVEAVVDGKPVKAHFKHNESDGAIACTRRALEALEAASARGADAPPREYQRSDRIN